MITFHAVIKNEPQARVLFTIAYMSFTNLSNIGHNAVEDKKFSGGDFLLIGKLDGFALAAINFLHTLIEQRFENFKILANLTLGALVRFGYRRTCMDKFKNIV